MGQYAEAEKLLARMQTIIAKVGGADKWNISSGLIWVQHRMNARQQIEYLGVGQKINGPLEWAERVPSDYKHPETPLGAKNDLPGTLKWEEEKNKNYCSISEVGMLLVHLLAEAKTCAKDEKGSTSGISTPSSFWLTCGNVTVMWFLCGFALTDHK